MTPLSNSSDAQKLLSLMKTELKLLADKILVYREVFGSDEVVALLSVAAPNFCKICFDALFDDLVLSLTRLADPPATSGHLNASLGQLVSLLDPEVVPGSGDIANLRDELLGACKRLRCHRNKRIAHLSHEFGFSQAGATDNPAELFAPGPLPGINLSNVEEAFRVACTLVSKVCVYLDGRPFSATPTAAAKEAGPGLVRLLSHNTAMPNDC